MMVDQEHVQSLTIVERGHASLFAENFKTIFRAIGFDPKLIKQHGAICCDVEYGAEVVAITQQYSPKKVYASEPICGVTAEGQKDDVEKATVLSDLCRSPRITLLRLYSRDALAWIASKDPLFRAALYTRLNIFPEFLREGGIFAHLQEVAPLLALGGIALLSVSDPDHVKLLERVAGNHSIPHIQMETITFSESRVIGSGVLMAKKTQ